jgi:alpha-glucoside transport system permease protein
MTIIILKIFDIVFVMTGGNFETEVIANRMFEEIVTNVGRSTSVAVLLLILTIPVMIYNIHRFRQEEAMR